MTDSFGRKIDYMRISVTDLCDLRCRYCMPEEGVKKLTHGDILSLEEILEITEAASELGVKKVRITGGEPLVRRGITGLCARIAALPDVEELALTTNGTRLADMAGKLKAAGVHRVNISIDTLDAEKYAYITRGGRLERVLDGIRAALTAGLSPVKLNVVLIGGFNDGEIGDFVSLTRQDGLEVRFIELMPIGESVPFWENAYLPNSAVLERCPELRPLPGEKGGVARLYAFPGAPGRVGLINPISSHFCAECNRLRLTADGMLKPCLHSDREIPVRGLHGEALRQALRRAIEGKPNRREELDGGHPSTSGRRMNEIGG